MQTQVPFIYNYCDRWCERCAFTARCAVFTSCSDLAPEEEDPGAAAFRERLSVPFGQTLRGLKAAVETCGLTLEEPAPEEMERWQQARNAAKARAEANPLIAACTAYAAMVDAALTASSIWRDKGMALAEEVRLGIRTPGASLKEIELVDDCHQVIRWYQYFIGIKFRRALSGLLHDSEDPTDPRSDAAGSAKVALLGVERSRLALTSLFRLIPDEDRLLPLLGQLERIDTLGKQQFPGAGGFVRPGFDDGGA